LPMITSPIALTDVFMAVVCRIGHSDVERENLLWRR